MNIKFTPYHQGQQAFYNGYNEVDLPKFYKEDSPEGQDWLRGLTAARDTARVLSVPRSVFAGTDSSDFFKSLHQRIQQDGELLARLNYDMWCISEFYQHRPEALRAIEECRRMVTGGDLVQPPASRPTIGELKMTVIDPTWYRDEWGCTFLIKAGGSLDQITDRFAFIEKTPRVRIREANPHGVQNDGNNWAYCQWKGDGPDDAASMRWCVEMLKLIGHEFSKAQATA